MHATDWIHKVKFVQFSLSVSDIQGRDIPAAKLVHYEIMKISGTPGADLIIKLQVLALSG